MFSFGAGAHKITLINREIQSVYCVFVLNPVIVFSQLCSKFVFIPREGGSKWTDVCLYNIIQVVFVVTVTQNHLSLKVIKECFDSFQQ